MKTVTPRGFIADLKARFPGPRRGVDSVPEHLKTEWQRAGRSSEDLAKLINKDFAEHLLDRFKPRLPDGLRELFDSGVLAIGAIEDRSPNAYLVKLGMEGYAIIFHTGLKDFIYRVARVLATRFVPRSDNEQLATETVAFEETARIVADIFWWFQETNWAFGPQYPIADHQRQIANLLALEAETFLLAHEIGHAIDDGTTHQNDTFLSLSHEIPLPHREEHAADLIAIALVMELHNQNARRDPFNTPLVYAGAEFALQIYKTLEVLGFQFKESHPSAASRLERIRAKMRSECESDASWQALASLAVFLESIFTKIVALIQDPGEHEAFFDRQAQSTVSELDSLLERCTGGTVPNYIVFCTSAGQIFDRGYSHVMLERVAQVALAFFGDVQRFEHDRMGDNDERWIRFQKFKLLLEYIDEWMTEPARSVFLKALDRGYTG